MADVRWCGKAEKVRDRMLPVSSLSCFALRVVARVNNEIARVRGRAYLVATSRTADSADLASSQPAIAAAGTEPAALA